MKMLHSIFLYVIIAIIYITLCPCANNLHVFYEDAYRGWYWFESNQHNDDALPEEEEQYIPSAGSYTEALQMVQAHVEEMKAQAILDPTIENIRDYIALENVIMSQSEKYAIANGLVRMLNPDLDRSLLNGTNEVSRSLKAEEKIQMNGAKIQMLGKHYGFIYFYDQNSIASRVGLTTLLSIAQRYDLSIAVYSVGGKKVIDQYNAPVQVTLHKEKIVQLNEIKQYPALFAFAVENMDYIPVFEGLLSAFEMEKRFLLLSDYVLGGHNV